MRGGSLLDGASGGRQVLGRQGGGARTRGRVVVLLLVVLGGCDGSINGPVGSGPAGGSNGGPQNGSSGGGMDGGIDGGSVLSSELPCAAYDVLSVHCWGCHGSTPSGGAPQSLATLAALQSA